jgi:single-stranded-DNA-specific exonuclease
VNLKIKTNKIEEHYPGLKVGKLVQTVLKNLDLTREQAEEFLNSHNLEFEDPFKIFGTKEAVAVIEEAIKNKQKIVIHGDFDVDGVSATAILWDYLHYERGADCTPIIPHRVDEGYGLSEKTLQKAIESAKVLTSSDENTPPSAPLLKEGKSSEDKKPLLITVDCGIKDVKFVEQYKDKIDFVITDHHQFATNEKDEIILPDAKAVVHSAHPKSKFPCMISGAATAWQVVRAMEMSRSNLNSVSESSDVNTPPSAPLLKEGNSLTGITNSQTGKLANWQTQDSITDKYIDLVALSTVCDIIPLGLENRKFIQKGLKKIGENQRIGLSELLKLTGINPREISAYHFGFVLGPRLNAPGRVLNDATDSLRLLATRNLNQAQLLATKLHELNVRRQELTTQYIQEASSQIDESKKAIVILGEGWPEGILGLVAGKLAEKYYKPTFVGSIGEGGHIVGSSRSPLENFYLNKALEHAKAHLERAGGHKQAAGFASNKEIFTGFEDVVLEYIAQNTNDDDFIRQTIVDIELEDLAEIALEDVEELSLLEPFGMGNNRPLFLIKNASIKNYNKIGKEGTHLKLNLNISGKEIEAIGFGIAEKYKDLFITQEVSIIGHLSINVWNNNKKMQLEIKEILV